MTELAGRYVLDREIGRGGMGAVWLGHDTVLDRTVAVKQIGLTSAGATPDLARAEREAHLAARVTHQNVVSVFDLVEQGGQHWLVMEHVDGPSLAAVIVDRGHVEPDVLAPILAQVAAALAASHEHGIVHRDVKPSNILLTSTGRAKLTDFGVARAQADASLTQTGMVTGSIAYLAPEVATGRPATAASDVWSLGATAFHALSGHAPYKVGDHLLSTMYSIVNDDPPRLDGAGPLVALVTAMMQHDPEARPSMTEIEHSLGGLPAAPLADEATQAMAAVPPPPPPASTATTAFQPLGLPIEEPQTADERSRPAGWLPAAGAAAAVVAVVAVGVAVGGDDEPGLPSAEPTAAATAEPDTESSPSPADEEVPPDARLEGFASDYLTAASNDPETGFRLLTPEYQRESGGIDGYRSFWDNVSNLDVESVQGDAEQNTVSYTYSYDFDGDDDRRTEDVTLRLTPDGDGYLIAGTA